MQSHSNVIQFPKRIDGNGAAHFIAWCWSRGEITIMVEGFDWAPGLPLNCEITTNWYYTKAKVH